MKKITALFLCILMTLSGGVSHAAYNENRIHSLGLVEGVPDDSYVKRIDFIKVALRLLGFFDINEAPDDNDCLAYAASMGIIDSSEDGKSRPLDSVTDYEAIKMLVCALGYGGYAKNIGGDWPDCYIRTAAEQGINKGVGASGDYLTYDEMIKLADNFLDLYPIVYKGSGYERSDETIYENLMSHRSMKRIRGIFTQTSDFSIISQTDELAENRITIDGVEYNAAKDFSEYLGYYVEAYLLEEGDEIISVTPYRDKNEEITADAEDVELSKTHVRFYDENGKRKNIDDDAYFVLNGRKLGNSDNITVNNGSYKFLDNDGDGKIDVVFISEYYSFVVKKIGSGTNTIYFDDDLTFRGAEALRIDYDDNDKKYTIENKDGEEKEFSDIKVGDAVSVFADERGDCYRIVVNDEKIDGKISSVSGNDSEAEVVLDGKKYKIAIGADGKGQYTPELNVRAVYVIDAFGNLCGTAEELESEYKYAYAVKSGKDDDDNLWIKLITGTEPQKHTTVKNGEETISYYYQNDDFFTLNTESKVILNDKSVSSSALSSLDGKIIGYKLSSGGKIKEINTYDLPGRIYTASFNAKITAFSSSSDGRGYLMDKKTAVICLPKVVNSDDDWFVRVHVMDESSTMCVWGQTAFPENPLYSEAANAETVDFIILNADMDSSQPIPVQDTDKVCILGSSSRVVSTVEKDNGDVVSLLDFLEGEEHKSKTVAAGTDAEKTAENLHKGDIFQYVEDGHGRIVTIKKIASMQGMGNDYKETIYGDYFGIVSDIQLDRYDYISNEIVDLIKIDIYGEEKQVKEFTEDPQPIYRYDRKTGNIYVGKTEDIASYKQVGDQASKAYAYMVNGDLTALVIIED